MKKIFNWLLDDDILSILDYFVTVGWFGYVLRIIANSNINIFIKIILIIGGIVLGFDHFITHHDKTD